MTFVKRGELACFAILAVVAGCRDAKELPLEAADLDCGPRVTTHMDYGVGATGTRDVTSAAEEALPDMRRPEDVLGRVQLASESVRIVALVRNGRTLATANFNSDGAGGWLLSSVERCGWRPRQPGG